MSEEDGGSEKKIVVMGDGGVGKSCFINVFVGNDFPAYYDATIFEKYRANIGVDDKHLAVQLHDTVGQYEFEALLPDWIREADAIVLLYSVASQRTFEYIQDTLYPLIIQTRGSKKIPIFLCGNKCDLPADEHEVKGEVAQAFAQNEAEDRDWGWIEASAKGNLNVRAPFEHIARKLIEASHSKMESTPPEDEDEDEYATQEQVLEVFRLGAAIADKDGSGFVDKKEFIAYLMGMGCPEHIAESQYDGFVADCDADHDGKVSVEEMVKSSMDDAGGRPIPMFQLDRMRETFESMSVADAPAADAV